MTPEHESLLRTLRGNHAGFTRFELAGRLGLHERSVRDLIEDIVAAGVEPIIAERIGNKKARYRIAQAHEHDLVNAANHEDYARAVSLHKKSRGRLAAFERKYAPSMFLADVPDLEGAR